MASAVAFVASAIFSISAATIVRIAIAIAIQVISARRAKKAAKSRGRQGLTLTVSESDYPRRIIYGNARVGGIRFYLESTGSSNDYVHLVLGIGEGPIKELKYLYFNEEKILLVNDGTDSNGVERLKPHTTDEASQKYTNHVRVKFYTGTESQIADADLINESEGNWTDSHRLQGIAYVYIRLRFSSSIFDQGLPDISFEVDGRNDILDVRTNTTGYSNNAALCWNHYITMQKMGPGALPETVEASTLIAAANVCDEAVPVAAGGTEPRYAVNGVVTLEDHARDILADFQGCMAGWRTFSGGMFQLFAGVHEAPTFEITEDMIVGQVVLKNRMPKRERANIVKTIYYASEHHWQFTDAPVREKASYISEDGEELTSTIELPMVHKGTQAQRIGNIELERGRFQKTVSMTCNLRAFPAVAGRNVMFSFSRYGWDRKIFLVQSSQPSFKENGECLMELSLREVSPTVYDWSTADELPVTTPPPLVNEKQRVSGIQATPAGGVYLTTDFPLSVALSTLTSGAAIRWSKAGIPDTIGSGNAYTGNITVNQNGVIFAQGFKTNYADSGAMLEAYTVEQVERPTATPAGGTFGSFPVNVTLATATSGATIRWSKSAVPATSSDGTAYSSPVAMADGETLYARAFKTGLLDSDSITEAYTS